MSYHEYVVSKGLIQEDPPFYALVMAAMRQADTANSAKLRAAFPETWAELDARYNAPGGILDGDDRPLGPVAQAQVEWLYGVPRD